jgi:hypothetical protein
MKTSPLSLAIHLYETIDVAQCNQLLDFVQLSDSAFNKEGFHFSKPFATTTRPKFVFNMQKICTEVMPRAPGDKSGLAGLEKAKFLKLLSNTAACKNMRFTPKRCPQFLRTLSPLPSRS